MTQPTEPKPRPKNAHESNLPDPRPRNEILAELLASYQVDPDIHLYDILYRLQMIIMDLRTLVERTEQSTCRRRK